MLKDNTNPESQGNKAVLEKKINIRASDYKLCYTKKYYKGSFIRRGQLGEKTTTQELINIASTKDEFLEDDIAEKKSNTISSFIEHVRRENLIQKLTNELYVSHETYILSYT